MSIQQELFELEFSINPNAETKKCNKCLNLLPVSCFFNDSGGNYLKAECKKCRKKLYKVRQHLKKINTKPDKDYICPICNSNEQQCKGRGGNKNTAWVLDHDHKTKTFRGWLCHKCNRALGNFDDDIQILSNAINYLTASQQQ
jgi:hypothetical protein